MVGLNNIRLMPPSCTHGTKKSTAPPKKPFLKCGFRVYRS